MTAIADLMKQIANWAPLVREQKMVQAQAIADYNRQHFFSKEFFDLVTNELKTNLKKAFEELKQCNNYQAWVDRWQKLMTYPAMVEFLEDNQSQDLDNNQLYVLPDQQSIEYLLELAQSRLAEVANKT